MSYSHFVRKPVVFGIALCLGVTTLGVANAGLLGGVTTTATTTLNKATGTLTGSTTSALIADRANRLRNTMATQMPSLVDQAKASPIAVYQLYHLSLHNPFAFLPQFQGRMNNDGPQRFLDRFPTPQHFAGWLETLRNDPAKAIAAFQSNPAYGPEMLENLDIVTRMLAERLPAGLANNLPVVGQLLAGLLGGGRDGLGPLSTGATSGISHATTANGVERMWCHVTHDGGMLGRILRGAFGDPAYPSDGGAGYGPSLLPYYDLGSSPTGTGLALSADYSPLLNTNDITGDYRELITRTLPVLPSVLPNTVLGILNFRTYHVTDRTGAGADAYPVPANHPDWTAAAIDIAVPGVMRLWTVEFICPGLNRHRVAAFPPDGSNSYYDPAAESNYTGYTNIDLTHRKATFSWGFGDGVVDDVWVYGHYAPFAVLGNGDTGPGVEHPAGHEHH